MKKLVENFPNNILESLQIANQVELNGNFEGIENIVITGLGGSGIGGTIFSKLFENELKLPVIINKGYFLPEFVSSKTLLVACSYSGNTEETMSALNIALKKRAKVIGITSGGKLKEAAVQNNFDCIEIPGGLPPRAAFAYPFVQLIGLFAKLGLIAEQHLKELPEIASFLKAQKQQICEEAEIMAKQLYNTLPIIYAEDTLEGLAVRLRQQINENAKMLAWHHVVPELNHNEIVGWRSKNEKYSIIFLQTGDEYSRNQHRLNYVEGVTKPYCGNIFHVFAKGDTQLQKAFYLIHFGDWLSVFLAEVKQIDPVEVRVIENLKEKLKGIKD